MASWIEDYMKLLAKHEGTRPAKATEGGGYTRGYGITTLAESFLATKGANAEEMSDEELARAYVLWNVEQLKKKFDNYDDWPASVQMATVDLAYNGGNVLAYKNFSKNLSEGNYQEAMAETLDIVGANDPKTGKRGALRGLGNRRFDFYNMVADELKFPKIQKLDVIQQGAGSLFSYTTADGATIDKPVAVPIHSASGSYDSVKKKTESVVTEGPLTKDLSNQELVDLANQKIAEAKNVTSEPVQTITATQRTPDVEIDVDQQTAVPTNPVPVDITGDNTVVDFETRGGRISSINRPQTQAPVPPEMQDIQSLIEQDIAFAGPVTEAITKEQFGTAAPVMFTDNTSEIYGAAFRQVNPVLALRDLVSDAMAGVEDDPDYDPFADPQLKNHMDSMWRFYDSKSEDETTRRLSKLMQEFEDQSILQSSFSMGPQVVAAMASPSTVTPVAPLGAMKATSAMSRFASGAAFTGSVAGVEQAILTASKEDHDASHALLAIGVAGLIGGSINAAFGNRIAQGVEMRRAARDARAEEAFGDGGYYRSAGAAVNPEVLRDQAYKFIEDEGLRETGIGVEKVPFNPVLRMLKSSNPFVRALASEMVDLGGMIQKKVDKEIAQTVSVESKFNSTYIGGLVQSLREIDEQFLAARGIVAKEGDIARSFQVMGVQAKDFFNRGGQLLTNYEFRVRVGKAMTRNGRDSVQDAMTPYVEAAARSARQQYDFIGNAAQNAGLFERQIMSALSKARELGQVERIAVLEARLQKIRSEGLFTNTAESYLNRIYRIDKIMADPERFRNIIRQWGANELQLVGRELDQYVDDMFDSITRSKPYQMVDEIDGMFEDVSVANSAKMREFEIPDELIEDFLERDIEVLMRHHTKQMGMDIEIHKAFGSVDMRDVIKSIEDDFARQIDETADPVKKESLRKEMLSSIKDIRGLRDRLRGTYGASKDPHAMSSRFVRTMKSFNVIVGMGGATISSIPDMARIVMVEGFKNTWHYGLRNSFRTNADLLRKLNRKEMGMAGVAADATLGLRAAAFADVGDVFGNRMALERIVNGSTGVMFMLNGLNMWNQALKEFAGNVTSLRMSDAMMKPWRSLSKRDKEKFLANGIDESMHRQMKEMITEFGEQVDGYWLPNTDLWTNQQARLTYRAALNQQVNRIIITPGAGDRALWTSTELGSLITQFKSYGQAATIRMLTSGLQEKDQAFWQGAFLLVGLGAMVNEIKRLQYGIDKKESFDEKLVNAIERSGITGWFMEPNNIIEKFSNHNLGIGPLMGDRPYPVPFGAKMGAAFGPAGSNLVNIAGVSQDFLGGNVDQKTMESLKFITPGASLPGFGNLVDKAYGID